MITYIKFPAPLVRLVLSSRKMKHWIVIIICLFCVTKGYGLDFGENGLACGMDPEDNIDVCKDYSPLDEPWRHISNSGGDNCDVAMVTGWYRIYVNGSSAQIPTVCIKNSACGTTIPMRVDLEERPMPEEGCTMQAFTCGSYVILGKWDCCVLRQKTLIHNCGGFYVYKLTPPDRCHMGYCSQVLNDDIEHLTVKTGESAEIVTPSMSYEDVSTEDIKNVEIRDVRGENSEFEFSTIRGENSEVGESTPSATPVCSRACHLSTPVPVCSRSCRNGDCIQDNYWCDGIPDCDDNSDEDNCTSRLRFPCPEGLQKCDDGSCKSPDVECNVVTEDEVHTSTIPTHTYTFPIFARGTTLTTTSLTGEDNVSPTITPSSHLSQGSGLSTDTAKVKVLPSPQSPLTDSISTQSSIENVTIHSDKFYNHTDSIINSNTDTHISMDTSSVGVTTDILTNEMTINMSPSEIFPNVKVTELSLRRSHSTYSSHEDISPMVSELILESKPMKGDFPEKSSDFYIEDIIPTKIIQSSSSQGYLQSTGIPGHISATATTTPLPRSATTMTTRSLGSATTMATPSLGSATTMATPSLGSATVSRFNSRGSLKTETISVSYQEDISTSDRETEISEMTDISTRYISTNIYRIQTSTIRTPAIQASTVQTPTVETPTVETPTVQTPTVQTPTLQTSTMQTSTIQESVSENIKTSEPSISNEVLSTVVTELDSSNSVVISLPRSLSMARQSIIDSTAVREIPEDSASYLQEIHESTASSRITKEKLQTYSPIQSSFLTSSSQDILSSKYKPSSEIVSSIETIQTVTPSSYTESTSTIDHTKQTVMQTKDDRTSTLSDTTGAPAVDVTKLPPFTTSTSITTTTRQSSNEVLLIFKLGERFRDALQLFKKKLQLALVKMMNRFYQPSRKIRSTDTPTMFVSEDVHILNTTITGDNLTVAQVAIDNPGNISDQLIPGDELLKLLQRDDVRQFILDQLMDPDALLIEAVPVDSGETTFGNRSTTLIPKIKDKEDLDIHTLFFANLGLMISIIVITSVCIICVITAVLYVRSKGKRGNWTCKTKDYYIKCEKTLLMDKNRRNTGQIDSPLTDTEIMNDEEQMVEKVPLSSEENLTNDPATQSSNGDTDNDNGFDDKGWIIPVNELLVQNGQRLLVNQEDTKL